jgi:hypothetical protein
MDDPAFSISTLARQMRRAARRLQSALPSETKFNPDWSAQPRIPPGNSDGGQWTDGGGGRPSSNAPRSQPRSDSSTRDIEPSSDWRQVRREALVDGSGERTIHEADDGARITTERRKGLVTGAETVRYIVQSPEDGSLVVDQDRDGTYRIYGAEGQLIAAARWGPNGPEPVAVPQLAHHLTLRPTPMPPPMPGLRDGARSLGELIQRRAQVWFLAVQLYTQLAQSQLGGQAIISFRFKAKEFGGSRAQSQTLEFVGSASEEDIERVCPSYGEVRNKTTEFANELRPLYSGRPQAFGTAVHTVINQYVKDQNRDGFKSEQSITKSIQEYGEPARREYGEAGTLRVDIYEELTNRTVCVYDIKTGKSGLSWKRIVEIADAVHRLFEHSDRFLIIEVRPD